MSSESAVPVEAQRRYYLDWIRVLMILLVFVVHSAMPFNSAQAWGIMNADTSFAITAWIGFCYQWGLQLFFLVAGAGSGLALRFRSSREYVSERLKRIMVPYVFGVLTMSPVEYYLEGIHKSTVTGPFLRAWIGYFRNWSVGWNLSFGLEPYHLWFLRYLLDYSLLAFPFFLWFATSKGRKWVFRLASLLDGPAMAFVCAIPIALIQIFLRAKFHGHGDWSDFLCWFTFFLLGYLLAADQRVESAISRYGTVNLLVGVACFSLMGVLYAAGYVEPWEKTPSYSPGSLAYEALRSVNTCAWVFFLTFLARRFLNSGSTLLRQVNEAALPVYVLHHLVVIFVASRVVQLQGGILIKYVAILTISSTLIILAYGLVISRFNVTRFLFGMSQRRRAPSIFPERHAASGGTM